MTRALVVHVLVIAALASCATVSGLADKEAVDCPGCPEDGGAALDAIVAPIDGGNPDVMSSFTKPDGWELVAYANVADGGSPPQCPSGFDDVSDVGTNPSTSGIDTCECTCAVGQQAACTGKPTVVGGTNQTCDISAPADIYTNNPAGACLTDFPAQIDRTGRWAKVKLAEPSGGTCNAAAKPHPERVQLGERRRVCGETSRCDGNQCDATVPPPFSACLASPKGSGDRACPAGFPNKLVAGRANVTCTAGCSCNVTRTPCTGTFTYYKDTSCTTGAAGTTADDTCRNLNASGMYAAYKVVASTTTGCTAGGTSTATVTSADVRTFCCP